MFVPLCLIHCEWMASIDNLMQWKPIVMGVDPSRWCMYLGKNPGLITKNAVILLETAERNVVWWSTRFLSCLWARARERCTLSSFVARLWSSMYIPSTRTIHLLAGILTTMDMATYVYYIAKLASIATSSMFYWWLKAKPAITANTPADTAGSTIFTAGTFSLMSSYNAAKLGVNRRFVIVL